MTQKLALESSPIELVRFEDSDFLIKRDDLLDEHFSGNKARKLSYFLEQDFPHAKKLISYGSVQSNSLYSMAALAKLKQWQLEFYVHNIPKWLQDNPIGNYAQALQLGARVLSWKSEDRDNNFSSINNFIQNKENKSLNETLFIPEGGHCEQAQYGIEKLAKEIESYCQKQEIDEMLVMLPSGTGTTSLFLNSFLRHSKIIFSVVTCTCVGDEEYLKKQFLELSNNQKDWPIILSNNKKYHFGKLYKEHYKLWLDLKQQTNIEFDLLYDPIGWRCLLDYLKDSPHKNVLYIHQGGLIGNQSMLARYKRKNKQTQSI
ncbi:MAG: 1-aminocyclopropane-1-carboxylate deaminase [Gammaproteobacteria bacterium]|nr:MAG: 1-aminocyclopropane-1-carboxylate deaminase [Gammaproteobacteria bacterium]